MNRSERERFLKVEALLEQALALPPAERGGWLEACDPELRGELAALLALDGVAGPLDRLPQTLAAEAAEGADAAPLHAQRFGPYVLHELIGEGGMATVWRAERADGAVTRTVAVKCLKAGLATPELRARFLREQQILAGLTHPNIARLYDAGVSAEGVPYIVMELIDGEPVTDYCDRHRLALRERLALFRRVLDAVACAHQNLIVHRDLKPANILVAADGQPRLLDFGIAKLLDEEDDATRTQARALTPGYAAPEQFHGGPVTTATDVYALGVVLYELLTGARPRNEHDPRADPATAGDPPPASQALPRKPRTGDTDRLARLRGCADARHLAQALRGDLDTLLASALRADPARRYRDAAALDADIERHLRHLPLHARRDSRVYRAAKFIRRNWLVVAALGGVLIALTAGAWLALWQAGQARAEAARASAALAETEQALRRAEALREFLLDLFRSARPDRPRDRLPSTEEILALGAERALDPDSAPPAERVGMLMAIGNVYREQNWNDQARPLLDAAVALARESGDRRPDDLALALWHKALLVMGERDLEQADALLREAESVVEGSRAHRDIFVKVRGWRAWGEFLKGNPDQVIRLAEPVYARVLDGADVDARVRVELIRPLATAYKMVGDLEAAARLSSEIIENHRRMYGEISLSHVVSLGNSIDLEHFLGRLQSAESKARRVIALYDRIFEPEHPTAYRAVARSHLATTLLNAGRFDEALRELDSADAERARARGRDPESWEYRYLRRGEFLARMHHWADAEADLRRARELFVSPGEDDRASLVNLDALLAWVLCNSGDGADGEALLAEVDGRLEAGQSARPLQRMRIHEARAACDLRAGRPAAALREVDAALSVGKAYPGLVLQHADRRILRARALAALGRHAEAEEELAHADRLFPDLGLEDHPHRRIVAEARRSL